MRAIITNLLNLLLLCGFCESHHIQDGYHDFRNKILESESRLRLGGNTTLSVKENIVNECLMRHKIEEVDYGFDHPELYNFSRHFFKYKDWIPRSKVYNIIKDMPKGSVLHIHDVAVLGPDYMLNLTYKEHLYVCIGKRIQFLFSNVIPNTTCDNKWRSVSDVRNSAKNVTQFDSEMRQHFTLVVDNPDAKYPNIKECWNRFYKYFETVRNLLTYKPIWKQYVYDALKSLRDDNIMYAEIRSSFHNLYDLNGTVYDRIETAKDYRKVIDKFLEDNPDFFGVKLILSSWRGVNESDIAKSTQLARNISKVVPDLIVGFDLVGQEDLGRPLLDFVPQLQAANDLNFFFHAGETDWFGTSSDENLIDAVLLGAKRIGHAYALTKHPIVMQEIIERDIGIEVNVLSNSILSLVRDVRNHPLSVFLSYGLPVVLSSDDPGVWEADPLSHDFYVAFVGVAGKHSDLGLLKTLAFNSLKYSALDHVKKQKAIEVFLSKWNHFIDSFDCSLY